MQVDAYEIVAEYALELEYDSVDLRPDILRGNHAVVAASVSRRFRQYRSSPW